MTPMTELRNKDRIAKADVDVPGDDVVSGDALNNPDDSGVLYVNGVGPC